MAEVVASRDLRNRTAEVLRRVERGESLTITVNGRPVALLGPLSGKPRFMPKAQFTATVLAHQADPALTRELRQMLPDTTDDLRL